MSVKSRSKEERTDGEQDQRFDEKLTLVMNALAESVLWISDEDFVAECLEDGEDPVKEAGEIRMMLLQELRAACGRLRVVD